jgi:hypothetical protein
VIEPTDAVPVERGRRPVTDATLGTAGIEWLDPAVTGASALGTT